MKKSMLAVLLFVTPVFAQKPPQNQAAVVLNAAGCGPNEVQFDVTTDKHQHPTAQPEAGKALIYLIGDVLFGRPTTRVGIDGVWVGANHGESYFFFPVEPGDHHLCINWQSSFKKISRLGSAVSFTAEAGKIYYYRIASDEKKEHELGLTLELLDPAKGEFLISSSAFSTSHPKK